MFGVDDTLVSEELNKRLLQKYFSDQTQFQFFWSSTASREFYHWHIEILGTPSYQLDDASYVLEQEQFAPEAELWQLLQQKFGKSELLRCYVNGYTFGTEGFPHVDSDHEGEVTAILYLTDRWEAAWGGETNVFDQSKHDISLAVLPKKGRLIYFSSDRLHVGRAVSKVFNGIRTVLVYKFRPKVNPLPEIVSMKRALIKLGADKIPYGQKTLFEHLTRCYTLLKSWNAAEHVCKAGLFHNILGTSYFSLELGLSKTDLALIIGQEAADLVETFCWADRQGISLSDPRISALYSQNYLDLLLIEKANQKAYGRQ